MRGLLEWLGFYRCDGCNRWRRTVGFWDVMNGTEFCGRCAWPRVKALFGNPWSC